MTIREKIAARKIEQETEPDNSLNKALLKMSGIILTGYAIGTIIAFMIERLK